MHILFVDDERCAHVNFQYSVQSLTSDCQLACCFDADSALEYAKSNGIDCAFLDITLSGTDGIALAQMLRAIHPEMELVFMTGSDEYTQSAYQMGGRAYLTKPYSREELGRVLSLLQKLAHPVKQKEPVDFTQGKTIVAKTFGDFEFLVDGTPVRFEQEKAKELLAYLVHQMGGTASNAQIFFALWEGQAYTKATSVYVRRTVRALQETLAPLGDGGILVSRRNHVSIKDQTIACDAYALLDGNLGALDAYNQQYMTQYAWGREAEQMLNRVAQKMKDQP